jgi:hygromycin-B 4-O-kinase
MEGWSKSPVLHHGDMRLKNTMVDNEGRVTAIIDWDQAISSMGFYWDLSVALHDLATDAKQEFLTGYGLGEQDIRSAAPYLAVLNILNYAPFIEQSLERGDREKVEQYRIRLAGALDLYSL